MQKPIETKINTHGQKQRKHPAHEQSQRMVLRNGSEEAPDQRGTHEAGFIMVSFSLLVLTILAISVLGLSVLQYWKLNNKSRTNCIAQAYKTQTRITEKINYLISLNPKARKLHTQLRFWKMKLVAAIAARNVVGANQARLKISYFQSQIKSLDQLQRSLILTTNLLFQGWRSQSDQRGSRELHLDRSSMGLAPQYRLEEPATEKHAIWKFGTTRPSPMLGVFFNVDPSHNWKWHCGASIEERSNEWKPRLIEAKYYWNSLSLSS